MMLVLVAAPPAVAESTRDRQWHLEALDVAAAHRVSRGAGVTVAVIDSGVKADHRDLVRNVLPGTDFTGDDTKGHKDIDGHGTAMAGLIAAHGHGPGGQDGALGIAPGAKILPIRTSPSTSLAASLDYAVSHGATVISISLSGGSNPVDEKAVARALAADTVIVAGSGNKPGDFYVAYPAAYPGVVAVGATGRDGKLASITTTGEEMVLTAPGVDIASTTKSGAYLFSTGTSDSTAIVAGAAALIRSKYPKLSATEVVHRLTATATDKGPPGRDPQYGYGTLNLVAALTADVPPAVAQPRPSTAPTPPVASPAPSAAAQPGPGAAAPPLRLSPAFYVVLGLLVLLLIAAAALLAWWLIRKRGRALPPPSPAYPPSGDHVRGPGSTNQHSPG